MRLTMLFTADWHLRADVPRCRLETEDEWFLHQQQAVRFIVDRANALEASLCIVGDIFHTPVVSQKIFNMVLMELLQCTTRVFIMAGNHDMYKRTTSLSNTSYESLAIIAERRKTPIRPLSDLITAIPYGDTKKVEASTPMGIAAVHECCFKDGASIPPGAEAVTPPELLGRYPNYRIIVAGDQHHPFLYKHGKRAVINCGCITKQSVKFKDEELGVWLVADNDPEGAYPDWVITKIPMPADDGVVSDKHIVAAEDRSERLGAFVAKLQSIEDSSESLDFRARLLSDPRRAELSAGAKQKLEEVVENSYQTD